jgi:hypothetical protein
MPIHIGTIHGKRFWQYGKSGKKYTFTTQKEEKQSKKKAIAQGLAILFSQHKTPNQIKTKKLI